MVFALAKVSSASSWGGVAVVVLMGRSRAVWVGCAVAAAIVVSGCNSDSKTVSAPPSADTATAANTSRTAGSAPSTADVDAGRAAATAAYLGMWHDMATAAQTSDWKSPQLSEHATGDALSVISRGMYADHLNGLVTKGAPENSPKVSSAVPAGKPTTVLISDCGDSSHWLKYRKSDGKLADDKPGGRQAITAEVKRQADGTWKVARFAVEAVGSC